MPFTPYTRAYILLELSNGRNIRYVRDKVTDTYGRNKQYYGYLDTTDATGAVDDYEDQITTDGLIKKDLTELLTNYAAAITGNTFLTFPEYTAATELVRHNNNFPAADDVETRIMVPATEITTISVIEERVNVVNKPYLYNS